MRFTYHVMTACGGLFDFSSKVRLPARLAWCEARTICDQKGVGMPTLLEEVTHTFSSIALPDPDKGGPLAGEQKVRQRGRGPAR